MAKDQLEERVAALEKKVAKLVEYVNGDIQAMRAWYSRVLANDTLTEACKQHARREPIE